MATKIVESKTFWFVLKYKMFNFFVEIVDDILYIDHDDGAIECFAIEQTSGNENEHEQEHENESTSVSDNTFYDTDGASNFYRDKFNAMHSIPCDRRLASPVISITDENEHESHSNFPSDWASTGDDTSFYDDRSGALISVAGHDIRSITPHISSRGAYLNNYTLYQFVFFFFVLVCFHTFFFSYQQNYFRTTQKPCFLCFLLSFSHFTQLKLNSDEFSKKKKND